MIRLAQCYTGGVGSEIIRRLDGHPEMQLVGVLVHSEEKAGRDSGELVGAEPNGITTTTNLDDIIALEPDAAIWSGILFDHESIARLLRAGINVYTGYGAFFLDGEPEHDTMQEACEEGGASLAAGGNIPGLISDVLPIFLTGYTGRVAHIRAQQRNHCATYPSPYQLQLGLGIGLLPGDPSASSDEMWVAGIRQSAKMVAAALGIPYTDCVLSNKEHALAPHDIVLQPSGLEIPAGTVAAGRWTFSCYSGDHEYLTVSNEQTAALGLGPGWRSSHRDAPWRVEIAGEPPIVCEWSWPEGVDPTTAVLHLNVARAMNTVPRLVEAPTGCVSVLDFPVVAARDGLGVG
jgi:4-hydroxy-tetrahydrodipicolinate reductase